MADNTLLCTVCQEEELPMLDRMKIIQQNQQSLENFLLTIPTNMQEIISDWLGPTERAAVDCGVLILVCGYCSPASLQEFVQH